MAYFIWWEGDCNVMDRINILFIELSYLGDEAPLENLKTGKNFRLYEGAKLVAEGKIIDK